MVLKRTRDAARAAKARGQKKRPAPVKKPVEPAAPVIPKVGPLDGKARMFLRGLGHHLDPVVQVGTGGVSDAVAAETDKALAFHELLKVKVQKGAEGEVPSVVATLAAATGSTVVQVIGRVALLFRQNAEPSARKIAIPKRR
ncbi:MAG: ribosome assembly RNA-binding protein YhbY [Myxococcota bacterium]